MLESSLIKNGHVIAKSLGNGKNILLRENFFSLKWDLVYLSNLFPSDTSRENKLRSSL